MKDLDKQIQDFRRRVRMLMRKYVCPQCREIPKGKHCVYLINGDEDLCDIRYKWLCKGGNVNEF